MMHGARVIKNRFYKELSCHYSAEFGAMDEILMKENWKRE